MCPQLVVTNKLRICMGKKRKNTEEMSATAEISPPNSGSRDALISNSKGKKANSEPYGAISETNASRPASPDSNFGRNTFNSTVATSGTRPASPNSSFGRNTFDSTVATNDTRPRSPNSIFASSTNGEYVYEEFDSKLRTYICPTCAGTGKLTRGKC